MGKSKGTTTTSLDPQSAEYQKQLWGAAQAAGRAAPVGVDPGTTAAGAQYGAQMGAGNLGLGALQGDAAAYGRLANPYQQAVTDQTMRQYGDLRQQTMNSVNDAATQAGAFGGSRHGVATGVALGELGKGEQQQLAGLNYQGFGDTMGRAQQLANLGLSGAQGADNIGRYQQALAQSNDPAVRQFAFMQQAMQGFHPGQVTTEQPGHNPLTGAIGGALSGFASTGSPWGAAAGGIAGLFG